MVSVILRERVCLCERVRFLRSPYLIEDVGMDKSLSERAKKAKVKEMRQEIVTTHIPFYLGHFEKMLEQNEYLTGDKPSIADAQFLSTVRWLSSGNLDHIPTDCVDAYPKVKALQEKMEAHPAVSEYLESLKKK